MLGSDLHHFNYRDDFSENNGMLTSQRERKKKTEQLSTSVSPESH